jgi:Ca2+/Na+ antiporter
VRPIEVPPGGYADLVVVAALSILLLLVSLSHSRRIIRFEAVALLAIYVLYISSRSVTALTG